MISLLIILIVASAFLVPASLLYRPEYFLIAVLASLGILLGKGLIIKLVRKETLIFFFLIVFAALTLLIQAATGKGFVSDDAMILVRYFIYWLAIVAGIYTGLSLKGTKLISLTLLTMLVASIAISYLQYFNIADINQIMVPLYGEKYEILIAGVSWRRIIGTIGNANYWGLWLALCFVFCGFFAVIQHKTSALLAMVFLFVGIIMTGSRTALIASLAGLAIGLMIRSSRISSVSDIKKIRPLISIVIVSAFLYYGFNIFTEQYYENQNRFSTSNSNTFGLRIEHWGLFLTQMTENPYQFLIGRGPQKGSDITWADNVYLLILRDFGAASLIAYLSLWVVWFLRLRQLTKKLPSKQAILPALAILAMTTVGIFDLAADAWYNVRIIIPLLLGYGYVIARSHRALDLSNK